MVLFQSSPQAFKLLHTDINPQPHAHNYHCYIVLQRDNLDEHMLSDRTDSRNLL